MSRSQINEVNYETFEGIKHVDELENEYWLARELQVILEYKKWQKFMNVIEKAKEACQSSGFNADYHFTQVGKMINTAKSAVRRVVDFKLTRYACYLIVQNADPSKEVVALGQTYFAVQTRKQEISEIEYDKLTETEKRFYNRSITKKENYELNQVAKNAGVKNFDQFHNAGYKGLYNGETADDIFKRKKLSYREDILDNMGSDELIANMFRISQTKQKIEKENIKGEEKAKETHFEVGVKVRETIASIGGTMPEDFPTPEKSLKLLEKEKAYKKINNK